MANDDTGQLSAVGTKTRSGNGGNSAPQFYYVRISNPNANKRALFRSISEVRAKTWVETHVPHGEEVYLESPDGTTTAYHKGRLDGEYGLPVDEWQPFDPDAFQPKGDLEAPGQSAWADSEG